LLPPKYQLIANGLYQGPWGFDFGANLVIRQGYGEPFFRGRVNTSDALVASKNLLIAGSADKFRLDTVSTFDVLAEKMFRFGRSSVAVDFDVFNLFNNATVLNRQFDARFTAFNSALEIMRPRIARLGVRFSF